MYNVHNNSPMNTLRIRNMFLLVIALTVMFLLACGPSDEEIDALVEARVSEISANIPEQTLTATPVPTARITKITDGDTFWVTFASGNREKIRIIGVDAPETYSSNSPDEYDGITDTDCLDDWGNSATEFAIATLSGKIVQVIADPLGDERDRFDRLLAYIHVEGQDFSSMLVKYGFARVYREYEYSRKSVYIALEEIAKLNKAGLWGCTSSISE